MTNNKAGCEGVASTADGDCYKLMLVRRSGILLASACTSTESHDYGSAMIWPVTVKLSRLILVLWGALFQDINKYPSLRTGLSQLANIYRRTGEQKYGENRRNIKNCKKLDV